MTRRTPSRGSDPIDLVGQDLSTAGHAAPARRSGFFPVAVAVSLALGLGIAALRIDMIRMGYGLADSVREREALLEQLAAARAQVRSLRDPERLGRLAEEEGFVRPSRIIDLPAPAPRVEAVR